jgi:hypothetical protein
MRRIIVLLVVSALLVLTLAATASANARDFCVDRNDGAARFAKDNWVGYSYPTQGQMVKDFAKYCHF